MLSAFSGATAQRKGWHSEGQPPLLLRSHTAVGFSSAFLTEGLQAFPFPKIMSSNSGPLQSQRGESCWPVAGFLFYCLSTCLFQLALPRLRADLWKGKGQGWRDRWAVLTPQHRLTLLESGQQPWRKRPVR